MAETLAAYKGTELNREFKLQDNKLKYLVVGTGRCGTVYMAKLLSSVGIPCTHEGIFSVAGLDLAMRKISGQVPIEVSHISKLASEREELAGVSWFKNSETEIVADSSYMAAPFLSEPCFEDTVIIHVVRHPINVVHSFVQGLKYFRDECLEETFSKEYHEFIYKYVPMLKEKLDPMSRAALYYIEWNQMIERLAKSRRYFLHRIERPVDKLLTFLKVNKQDHYKNVESNHKLGMGSAPKHFNAIPVLPIRHQLEATYNRYYKAHNKI